MSDGFRDHYLRLGLKPFADLDAVKAAWRRLAKRHHPDRNPGDDGAASRFRELNESYQVLSDPAKRLVYDEEYARVTRRARDTAHDPFARRARAGRAEAEPPPAGESGTAAGSERRSAREEPPRGPRPRPGRPRRREIRVPVDRFEAGRVLKLRVEGLGELLEIRLPDPLRPGAVLSLAGLGEPGEHGGAPGALVLEFQVELPAGVSLEGSDLVLVKAFNPLRLMLGGEVQLSHPDGRRLALRLPAGAQPGQRLRVKGQGLPDEGSRGDLVLELAVAVPKELGAKARALAEKLLKLIGE